jgi:hypothetical protein
LGFLFDEERKKLREREREFCPLFVSLSMSRLGVPTTTALFEMIAVRNLEY